MVCEIEDEFQRKYQVIAGVRGRLFELNELIEEDPSIITTKPASSGFICIIQPKFNDIDYLLNKLVSLEKYSKTVF